MLSAVGSDARDIPEQENGSGGGYGEKSAEQTAESLLPIHSPLRPCKVVFIPTVSRHDGRDYVRSRTETKRGSFSHEQQCQRITSLRQHDTSASV